MYCILRQSRRCPSATGQSSHKFQHHDRLQHEQRSSELRKIECAPPAGAIPLPEAFAISIAFFIQAAVSKSSASRATVFAALSSYLLCNSMLEQYSQRFSAIRSDLNIFVLGGGGPPYLSNLRQRRRHYAELREFRDVIQWRRRYPAASTLSRAEGGTRCWTSVK